MASLTMMLRAWMALPPTSEVARILVSGKCWRSSEKRVSKVGKRPNSGPGQIW